MQRRSQPNGGKRNVINLKINGNMNEKNISAKIIKYQLASSYQSEMKMSKMKAWRNAYNEMNNNHGNQNLSMTMKIMSI